LDSLPWLTAELLVSVAAAAAVGAVLQEPQQDRSDMLMSDPAFSIGGKYMIDHAGDASGVPPGRAVGIHQATGFGCSRLRAQLTVYFHP